MQYVVNVDVVNNIRVEDELNVEFTEGEDELDELEDSSEDNSVNDIDFEDNANDKDDDDYFELNVDWWTIG